MTSSVAASIDTNDSLNQLIRRKVETYYWDYDWPHLRIKPFKALSAGQRYYDVPTTFGTLNLDRIKAVYVWWNERPLEIERGITPADFALYDSNDDERVDPTQKWDVFYTGSATQIEVWPLPASNSMQLQFDGFRALNELTDDNDICDLDDRLIVLSCAAEWLADQKGNRSKILFAEAQKHFATLKGRSQGGSREIIYGGSVTAPRRPATVIRVS